jgi:hypothetical protein
VGERVVVAEEEEEEEEGREKEEGRIVKRWLEGKEGKARVGIEERGRERAREWMETKER